MRRLRLMHEQELTFENGLLKTKNVFNQVCYLRTSSHLQLRPGQDKAYVFILFISPLFNQLGKLRTSSHLQLRSGQDKAKQFDTNNTQLHMGKTNIQSIIQ